MIQNPYLLLLLLLFPLYFYFSHRVKFYFRHAYLDGLSSKIVKNYINWRFFILLGVFSLVLAACNIVFQMKETIKVYQAHKYVLVNDGSGSMIDVRKENGIGNELTALISGNDKLLDFLGNRQDGSKDLVGAIVFSDDAFTVAGITDDPKFIQRKLKRIDYRVPPMAQGTNIESGLWAAVEMLLSHNDIVKHGELDRLQFKFYGNDRQVKSDGEIESIISRKDKFAGSSIIIFTNGIFNAEGNNSKMSSFKIIDFCRLVDIRVYFISIYDLDNRLITFCKNTGGRGDIIKGYNKERLEEIYNEIAVNQSNEYVVKEQSVDHSFSMIFGSIGLLLILVGMFIHTTFQLDFTEV